MLAEFRAQHFNPERWVRTGIVWAVLTTLILAGWDLHRVGQIASETWIFGIVAVVIGAPMFGLLFRFISRKAHRRAR